MTTNNHPANGPVSLDRLHQISEILSKAAAQSDGGNLGYAMADAVKVIGGAITAFGAEPVAYMTYKGYLLHAADPKLAEYSEPMPLYAAPQLPQPAQDYFSSLVSSARVRADKAMRKFPQPNYVLNKVAEESGEVIKAVIHYTEGREEWANVEGEIVDNLAMLIRLVTEGDQVIGFTPPESCRAVMLQAGNSPVAPDGWKVEAERLAEVHGCSFVVFRHGEEPQCADSTKIIISFTDEGLGHHSAAPQQDVKSALEHGMQRYSGDMQKLSEGD